MKDGTARRVPADQCEKLLATGQAKHFISNTVYRAMKFGIEVKNPKTRDDNGELRGKIRDAREKANKRAKKKAEKEAAKKAAEETLAEVLD
jgi:hypothetical protein